GWPAGRVQRELSVEHRRLEAAVPPLPLVLASGLSAYLASFGHLCTEQLVSQAMPAVVLTKRPEFARPDQSGPPTARSFADAVRVLRTRQNAEGGFPLSPPPVHAPPFSSLYAIHL